ncbi:MAG: hypothetical protein C4567_04530 [Deltaproteobacteria bacterium]|nr:MAG: hypothetical protein C4567_04530 [Deltaproteobacteria bacterium]
MITQDGPPSQEEAIKAGGGEVPPVIETPSDRSLVPEAKKKTDRKTEIESPGPGKEPIPASPPTPSKRKLVRQTGISGIFGGNSKEEPNNEEK